jgi:hypothetical protein
MRPAALIGVAEHEETAVGNFGFTIGTTGLLIHCSLRAAELTNVGHQP